MKVDVKVYITMTECVTVKFQLCPVVDKRIPHLSNNSRRTLSLKLCDGEIR